ncbi:hypothetical protein Ddc_24677 [Ditylenchus destructor]|nr:hypothetical protein Ddc_24677 [Ditylenchus destructor]
MDNDTMVEAFKYLNYSQLAKNSLVSKRFSNLIRVHRHSLALLYVNHVSMERRVKYCHTHFKIFDKQLSPEAYNEWVIRNQYSKQIPLEGQDGGDKIALCAFAFYKDHNYRQRLDETEAFYAVAEFSNDNWPLLQHFIRLITDQFIFIRRAYLIPRNDVCNLLTEAINSNFSCLLWEQLNFNLDGNVQKFINWTKNNVLCNELQICHNRRLSFTDGELPQEVLLDFFLTGARCTSEIKVQYYVSFKVVNGFVRKFMNLKNWNEYQVVESIEWVVLDESVETFWRFLLQTQLIPIEKLWATAKTKLRAAYGPGFNPGSLKDVTAKFREILEEEIPEELVQKWIDHCIDVGLEFAAADPVELEEMDDVFAESENEDDEEE